jgi:hypothetical protein
MNQKESGVLRRKRDLNWGCVLHCDCEGLVVWLGLLVWVGCLRLYWGRRCLVFGVGVEKDLDMRRRRVVLLLEDEVSLRAAVQASLMSSDSTRRWSVLWILIMGVNVKYSGWFFDMNLYTY